MALLTDINDLLNKRKVESDRIDSLLGMSASAIASKSLTSLKAARLAFPPFKTSYAPMVLLWPPSRPTKNDLSSFIDLPCRADMVEDMAIEKIIRYNDTKESGDFTKDFIKDFTKDFTKENESELTERQKEILILLAEDSTLTSQKISQKKPISSRTVKADLSDLQKKGIISREGGRKNGYWQLLFLPLD